MGIRRVCLLVMVFAALCAQGETKPNGLVMLFTDYGADELNVGSLKGAVYSRFPGARVDSLTNTVPPFDVEAGAHLLAAGVATFPPGTVFCCLVDPGIGADRRVLAMETANGLIFVAPDNGLLTAVAAAYGVAEVRACTNTALWRRPVLSNTFHGRDIYGPVAASLAGGAPLSEIGEAAGDWVRLDLPASAVKDGRAIGTVILIDAYGNCTTNITAAQCAELGLAVGRTLRVTVGAETSDVPFVHAYASVPKGGPLLLLQETGFAELALNMGDFAEARAVERGATVTIEAAP